MKDNNKVIDVNKKKKLKGYSLENLFSENGKCFQEQMEEAFSQILISKISAEPVGYLPAV